MADLKPYLFLNCLFGWRKIYRGNNKMETVKLRLNSFSLLVTAVFGTMGPFLQNVTISSGFIFIMCWLSCQ